MSEEYLGLALIMEGRARARASRRGDGADVRFNLGPSEGENRCQSCRRGGGGAELDRERPLRGEARRGVSSSVLIITMSSLRAFGETAPAAVAGANTARAGARESVVRKP